MFPFQYILFHILVHGAVSLSTTKDGCNCGLENLQSRVLNGKEISENKYPWLAHIVVEKDDDKYVCGGSLIDSRRVLTAAHCVHDMSDGKIPAEKISVYLGIHNLVVEGFFKGDEVSHHQIDPNYPKKMGYDIALLVLKQPVMFTREISPICIPESDNYSDHEVRKFTVAGWGIAGYGISPFTGELDPLPNTTPKEAEINYVPPKECAEIYEQQGKWIGHWVNTSLEICAHNPDTHSEACGGDSGGPLMFKSPDDNRWYLAGVVSRGERCPSRMGRPATYTKLTSIRESIENMETPDDFC